MSEPTSSPLFTAIVPLYNHARYIGQALDSIIAQSHEDWEAVVVDDGSTDESGRIADDYAAHCPRIRVIHQRNTGLAAARNTGLRHARGTWMALLDSDDLWLPDTLNNFAAFIAAHSQTRFIYGYYYRLNADGTITKLPGIAQDGPKGPVDLFGRMFLNPSCVCFRRELVDEVGFFDETLPLNEDYDLFLKIGLHTQYWPINHPTTLRRRHDNNLSKQSGRSRMIEIRTLERFLERLGGQQVIPSERVSERLAKMYYSAGRLYFRAGCFSQAADVLWVSMQYGFSIKSLGLLVLCSLLRFASRYDPRPVPQI
ncbi:MAG: glycosyltransferase family 2 protein [Bacillota bacterium]